jgi:hypothetical protein
MCSGKDLAAVNFSVHAFDSGIGHIVWLLPNKLLWAMNFQRATASSSPARCYLSHCFRFINRTCCCHRQLHEWTHVEKKRKAQASTI